MIASIRAQIDVRSRAVRLGIGDDCALLRISPTEEVAVTTDLSLEGVHFRRDWHPATAAGHRCLARGLSDLAAMGARPVAAFLSLAVPVELTGGRPGARSWVEQFLDGLLALATCFHVPLAGGDTAQSPRMKMPGGTHAGQFAADIVLIGAVKRGRALLRAGALAGDLVYVTGWLGGAAAELMALERAPRKFRSFSHATAGHPHLYPQPRLGVGRKLAALGNVTSAIDVSDGLSTDLDHLCEESGLSAELDAAAIPLHPLAIQALASGWVPSALNLALHGGEDYELLFTAPPGARIGKTIAGVPVKRIGRMKARRSGQPRMSMLTERGKREVVPVGGWEHFRQGNREPGSA